MSVHQRASLHPSRPWVTWEVWVTGHGVHGSEEGDKQPETRTLSRG